MKKKIFNLTIIALFGTMMLTACDSGSDAYKKSKAQLKEYKNAVKKAKTCDELVAASSKYGMTFMDLSDNLSPEESVKLMEYYEKNVESLVSEKEEKLCKE